MPAARDMISADECRVDESESEYCVFATIVMEVFVALRSPLFVSLSNNRYSNMSLVDRMKQRHRVFGSHSRFIVLSHHLYRAPTGSLFRRSVSRIV